MNCVPGPVSGLTEHFVLEVRESHFNSEPVQSRQTLLTPQRDQEAMEETYAVYKERNISPNFQLHDLEPELEYTILVYAENIQGKSKPILLKNVKIINPMESNFSKDVMFIKDLKSVQPKSTSNNYFFIVGIMGKLMYKNIFRRIVRLHSHVGITAISILFTYYSLRQNKISKNYILCT